MIIQPTKPAGSANLRLRGRRGLPDLGLRRQCGWRRQIVAFHRKTSSSFAVLPMGAQGSARAVALLILGINWICAQAGDAISATAAAISSSVGLTEHAFPTRSNRLAASKAGLAEYLVALAF